MECGMITPTPNTTEHRTPKTGYLSLSLPLPLLSRKLTSRFLLPISSRQIDESISDFYCQFLPAIIDKSISIADFFPPNCAGRRPTVRT
jgi:hypothetical protein